MKNVWIIAAVLAVGLVAGCSSTDDSTSKPNPDAPTTVESTKQGGGDVTVGTMEPGPGAGDAASRVGSATK